MQVAQGGISQTQSRIGRASGHPRRDKTPFRLLCCTNIPFSKNIFLAFLLCLESLTVWGQVSQDSGLRVAYTGALYGYFRTDVPGFDISQNSSASNPIDEFIHWGQARSQEGLLLGMGDNFAPEFGASIQAAHNARYTGCDLPPTIYNGSQKPTYDPPSNLYKTGIRVAPAPYCDNVVDFLLNAGYRVVVPGRDDFIYGSQWLRKIAMSLTGPIPDAYRARNLDSRLNILAANLRFERGSGESQNNICPLLFSSHFSLDDADTETCGPTVASSGAPQPMLLGWLQRVDTLLQDPEKEALIKICESTVSDPRTACPGSHNTAPDPYFAKTRITLRENETALFLAMLQGQRRTEPLQELRQLLKPLESPGAAGSLVDIPPDLSQKVNAALNSLLTTDDARKDLREYGEALVEAYGKAKSGDSDSILIDGESLTAGRRALLRAIWAEQEDIGFTLARSPGPHAPNDTNAPQILVIGVVGGETITAVSSYNLSLCIDKSIYDCGDRQGVHSVKAHVAVSDPFPIVMALLRGAALHPEVGHVVLMAQTQSSLAEELGARVRSAVAAVNSYGQERVVNPDMILSKADTQHSSPTFNLEFGGAAVQTTVLTPYPAYESTFASNSTVMPKAVATLSPAVSPASGMVLTNVIDARPPANAKAIDATTTATKTTTIQLFLQALNDAQAMPPEIENSCASDGKTSTQAKNTCDLAVVNFILERMASQSGADAAVLERRDFYLGTLPKGFDTYEACEDATYGKGTSAVGDQAAKERCHIQVALDRLLWVGSNFETVMLSGSNLEALIDKSQVESESEEQLTKADASQQWLMAFGIEAQPQSNLTTLYEKTSGFSLPQNSACKSDTAGSHCVNQHAIQPDASYSIATSDHIAEDQQIYTMMAALPGDYRSSGEEYLSEVLVAAINPEKGPVTHAYVTESAYEGRPLEHLDIAKWIAGFNWRNTSGGDAEFAQFQGVSDSRASAPYSQELDLETQIRYYRGWSRNSLGTLSDLAYDRSVLGNVAGSIVNPSFFLNNFDVGIFDQYQVFDNHPALLIATAEYQRQLTGTYLVVPYSSPAKGQLTQPLPAVFGFSGRMGEREESVPSNHLFHLDTGSYFESGIQFTPQRDLLRYATFFNGTGAAATEKVICDASGSLSIPNCIKVTPWMPANPGDPANTKNATLKIGPGVTETISTTSVFSWGAYWDVHLQKTFPRLKPNSNPMFIVQLDTKGDYFAPVSPALSTQTQFDLPVTVSVAFPFLRNLSLTPSYSTFLYEDQRINNFLFVNGFTMKVLWYYDRDSGVHFWRQLLFKGPASEDQTRTGRMK